MHGMYGIFGPSFHIPSVLRTYSLAVWTRGVDQECGPRIQGQAPAAHLLVLNMQGKPQGNQTSNFREIIGKP